MRRSCRFLLVVAACMAGVPPLWSQAAPAYRIDYWSTADGLPSDYISSLVQTDDGFLWLAAGGILVRFDGFAFRAYSGATDTLLTVRVDYLYPGLGDTLWIARDDGMVLSMADGHVAALGRPPVRIRQLVQDRRGTLLALERTPWRWHHGRFEPVAVPTGWHAAGWGVVKPARGPAGDAWVLGATGEILRITAHGAVQAGTTTTRPLVTYPARHAVLLVRRHGPLGEVVDGTGVVLATYRWAPDIHPALIDGRGRLWAFASGEVRVYAPGSPDPIARVGYRPSFSGGSILEDRSGDIWLAGEELARVEQMPFTTQPRVSGGKGLARQVGGLLPGPTGSVLAQGASAVPGVVRLDGAHAVPYPRGISGAFADRRGTVWTTRARGRRHTAPFVGHRAHLPAVTLPRAAVNPLLVAPDPSRPGAFWFAGARRLYLAQPYTHRDAPITDSVTPEGRPRRIAVGAHGVLWVLSDDSARGQELTRYGGSGVRRWSHADGLPAVEVRTILPDSDGAVWLGTYGGGLVRFAGGRFATITSGDGLPEDIVSCILRDGAGNFWMAGNRGVDRLSHDDAEAFLDGRAPRVRGVVYDRRDGLTDPETTGESCTRSDDGRLWFPTFGGAAVVDPSLALTLDSTPPLVHVLGIMASGDTLQPLGVRQLPRGERRLAIAYTAIDLRHPDHLRFEYRLEGVDRDWIRAGTGRVAVYNHVGPGTHTFHVRAINAGGVWSRHDATLAFTVPAYFTETIPFYLLLAALVVSGTWLLWWARTRQLRHRQEELTALVEVRTAKLGEALALVEAQADKLRTLDEAKSRFFANASHEFRTPLSLILGPVEDVRDGRAGPLPELAKQRLGSVLTNGRRLVQLVEQLLDVARLESGTLKLRAEIGDLVPLLRRISESFASLAERRGINFTTLCPVGGLRVRHDPDQMEKVFANLLGNALKFTSQGGRVELRVHVEGVGEHAWAVAEVADTGPGIPAAHQPHVFERFYQVDDSLRRTHEGAGIGLALARELVDLHGGTLTLRSVEGEGSTFTVRLPLAAGAAPGNVESRSTPAVHDRPAEAPVATRSAPAVSGPVGDDVTTVLVVEDNAELLAYLREHLAERYRVIEAGTGAEALELAREHVPDLIVSDVMMPELDGQAMCEAIKRDPETDFIPVILLTAKASRESRLAGLEGGADDYLAKPVDMRELQVRAANLIASRRHLKERWQEAERNLPSLPTPYRAWPTDAGTEDFLQKLYAVIAEHVGDEDFQVDRLAAALAMGRSTLYRKLEVLTGRSPMDLLWDYRLEQAAQWLGETDANVSEIAYGVGFKSVPHFCARFRNRFGSSPSAYRKKAGGR